MDELKRRVDAIEFTLNALSEQAREQLRRLTELSEAIELALALLNEQMRRH